MIRVLLAEDMHMVRGALVALLGLENDITVVAELDRGDTIVEAAVAHQPDVAVIDIGLPGKDGISAAAELRDAVPGCAVLVLTGLGSTGVLRRALNAQVKGFLLKDSRPDELAAAIRQVAAGRRVITPELAMSLWEDEPVTLTERELGVLRLAATGSEPKEIAHRLHLEVGTVRNYLTLVVSRLNARNRLDAVRIAREAGLLL